MKKFIIFCILLILSPVYSQNSQVISQIRFEGLKATSQNDALNAVGLRQGEIITPAKLNFAIKDLYAMQRFKNIELDVANTVDGAVLTFKVEEEALIDRITFEGISGLQAK